MRERSGQVAAAGRNGNLHISIEGICSADTPGLLVRTIRQHYRGSGNIFIHTAKVTAIEHGYVQGGDAVYHELLSSKERIYLVGSHGLSLQIPCKRVIVPPVKKARCAGRGRCPRHCGPKAEQLLRG